MHVAPIQQSGIAAQARSPDDLPHAKYELVVRMRSTFGIKLSRKNSIVGRGQKIHTDSDTLLMTYHGEALSCCCDSGDLVREEHENIRSYGLLAKSVLRPDQQTKERI